MGVHKLSSASSKGQRFSHTHLSHSRKSEKLAERHDIPLGKIHRKLVKVLDEIKLS